jgi:NADPH:quinone reductase-like Zn-dependent oxidoreductase
MRAWSTGGRLQPRETVLITAAAGGVGSAAVQIAVAVGARVVAVAGPPNHDYLLSLGASEVFDYHAAGHDAGDLIELIHAVWLSKKIIELVCSGTLAQAAQDYTLELNRASKDLHPDGASCPSPALSVREQQLRAEFMEAARRNLVMQASPYCDGPTLKPEWRKAATRQLARAESP